jgi:transposase
LLPLFGRGCGGKLFEKKVSPAFDCYNLLNQSFKELFVNTNSRKLQRSYTKEFKSNAVKLALSNECSIVQTAQNLGLSEGTLYNWVTKVRQNPAVYDETPGVREEKSSSLAERLAEEQRRNRDLLAINRRLTMERDILKKAAAYFAQDPS